MDKLKKGDIVWTYFPNVAFTEGLFGFLQLKVRSYVYTDNDTEIYCDIISQENHEGCKGWDIHKDNYPVKYLFKTKEMAAANAYKKIMQNLEKCKRRDLENTYTEIGYLSTILFKFSWITIGDQSKRPSGLITYNSSLSDKDKVDIIDLLNRTDNTKDLHSIFYRRLFPKIIPPEALAIPKNTQGGFIQESELSVRLYNVLYSKHLESVSNKSYSFCYVGDLVELTEVELLKLHGFGRKLLHEVIDLLNRFDLRLRMKLPETVKEKLKKIRVKEYK